MSSIIVLSSKLWAQIVTHASTWTVAIVCILTWDVVYRWRAVICPTTRRTTAWSRPASRRLSRSGATTWRPSRCRRSTSTRCPASSPSALATTSEYCSRSTFHCCAKLIVDGLIVAGWLLWFNCCPLLLWKLDLSRYQLTYSLPYIQTNNLYKNVF